MREFIYTEPGEPGSWSPSLEEIHGQMRIEYEACHGVQQPVAFLQVVIEGLERITAARGDEGREVVLRAVTDVIRGLATEGRIYSYRTPDGVIAMTTRVSAEGGEHLARTLVERARRLELPDDHGTLPLALSVGLALSQSDDEPFFETMLLVAQEGAWVASASGGSGFAHSQLYGLHQRKLERENPEWIAQREERREQATAAARHATSTVSPTRVAHGNAETVTPEDVSHTTGGPERTADPAHAADAPAPLPAGVDAALQQRIRMTLGTQAPANGTDDVEHRVLAMAEAFVQDALHRVLDDQATGHRMELELLQRRLQKLNGALRDSEAQVQRLAREGRGDDGVPSSFRDVQGIDDEERNYELKRQLMSKILQANLDLYAQLRLG